MSSAARTAGKVYKEVTIAGKKFRLSQPKRVGLQGDIEAFILSRKDDPIVIAVRACQQAPKDMHATIWDAAIRVGTEARIVTS
jgi:signal recognition particle GTPase